MDFPIVDLFDDDLSAVWLLKYFHENKLKCPHYGRNVEEAREFRQTQRSRLTVYRCGARAVKGSTIFTVGRYLRESTSGQRRPFCCCVAYVKVSRQRR